MQEGVFFHFQCWKFSLAFKSNSSIRDRILSLRLFAQNPARNYLPGKALKRATPGSLSFFGTLPSENALKRRAETFPCSVLCLSYLDTGSLGS